jgi:acetolactate decarboxylase
MTALTLGLLTLAPAPPTLFQYSVLETLNLANYDGGLPIRQLLKRGDFGVGTYAGLNGEMIVLDGKPYRADETGTIHLMKASDATPFACVTHFKPVAKLSFPTARNLQALQADIQKSLLPGKPYAIRVTGLCKVLRARSFPSQTPPYKPLPDLIPTQRTFAWENRPATLVGFFMPSYITKVNAPGFHFHSITEDRKNGGHVLDVEIQNATVELMPIDRYEVEFPKTGVPGVK